MKFWVFGLMVIIGLFHHLAGNEGYGGSYRGKRAFFFFFLETVGRGLKMRKQREMGEKI